MTCLILQRVTLSCTRGLTFGLNFIFHTKNNFIFRIKRSSECERLNKGDNVHQLPAWLSLPVAIIFALLFYGVYEAYVSLPKPVTLENEVSLIEVINIKISQVELET